MAQSLFSALGSLDNAANRKSVPAVVSAFKGLLPHWGALKKLPDAEQYDSGRKPTSSDNLAWSLRAGVADILLLQALGETGALTDAFEVVENDTSMGREYLDPT